MQDATEKPETEESSGSEDMLFLMVDRRTVEFIDSLATSLGVSYRWAIDHIVRTYAERFGLEPPGES